MSDKTDNRFYREAGADMAEREAFAKWYSANYASKLRDYPANTKCERTWMARAALSASQPKALTDTQRDDRDVRVKEIASRHSLDRTAAGGWIFENHELFKFAYAILESNK